MALIVEDGTAKIDADSYATVAEADTYWTNRNDAVWTDLDLEVKEAALRKAADFMRWSYRLRWAGYRKSETQALDWPREYVPAPDAYAYGTAYLTSGIIPTEVKSACIELAYRAVSASLLPDQERTTTSETVGPLSVTYDRSGPVRTLYRNIDAMLAPWIRGGGVSVPLARV
jgi:hypothetical protein